MTENLELQSEMTASQLAAVRNILGFTQAEMAEAMMVSARAYKGIESGEAMRGIHQLAAENVITSNLAKRPELARALLTMSPPLYHLIEVRDASDALVAAGMP